MMMVFTIGLLVGNAKIQVPKKQIHRQFSSHHICPEIEEKKGGGGQSLFHITKKKSKELTEMITFTLFMFT